MLNFWASCGVGRETRILGTFTIVLWIDCHSDLDLDLEFDLNLYSDKD